MLIRKLLFDTQALCPDEQTTFLDKWVCNNFLKQTLTFLFFFKIGLHSSLSGQEFPGKHSQVVLTQVSRFSVPIGCLDADDVNAHELV